MGIGLFLGFLCVAGVVVVAMCERWLSHGVLSDRIPRYVRAVAVT